MGIWTLLDGCIIMTAYYELTKGTYKPKNLTDGQIWEIFCKLFDRSSSVKTSSYKFALIYSLIENLKQNTGNTGKPNFNFEQIFTPFAKIYWELIIHRHLYQISGDVLSSIWQILDGFLLEYPAAKNMDFAELSGKAKQELLDKVIKKCSRNVLGALFGDTKELFYSFSKRDKIVELNPRFKQFLDKFSDSVLKLNFYQWSKFLSEKNPSRKIDINLFKPFFNE